VSKLGKWNEKGCRSVEAMRRSGGLPGFFRRQNMSKLSKRGRSARRSPRRSHVEAPDFDNSARTCRSIRIEGVASRHIGGIAIAKWSRTCSGPKRGVSFQRGQNERARDRLIAPTMGKASPMALAVIHKASGGKPSIADVPRRIDRTTFR
jgi:hypothetical protein